ncbi:hypothetical protein ACFP2T_43065 [Plantactinospora solaniradicis]|uniref:Uncharacterized protein n=1 Tax=Plantactinospora solaniradicis TaxID=1723736 RepID=A0ABW1KMS5_9ACTN
MHQLLLELIPGGAKKSLSAAQAKVLLATVRPRDAVGKARRRVAAELIGDLERVYRRTKEADKELKELVASTGTGGGWETCFMRRVELFAEVVAAYLPNV